MNVKAKTKSLLLILLLLAATSCQREKRKVIIVSEVTHRDAYYHENYETVYIKGIPVERDNGYAVSGCWYFDIRSIEDTNGLNIRSVHIDEDIWGNDSYSQGDTLEINLWEYQKIFAGPPQNKNQSETNYGGVTIINNIVISDTIYE
ncbi:MAG TPA: hypothetical protein PKI61_02420 [bacterium]|nr:hypothetical protein [bacterium]HPT29979.1 hypothetical protein [bacterium]